MIWTLRRIFTSTFLPVGACWTWIPPYGASQVGFVRDCVGEFNNIYNDFASAYPIQRGTTMAKMAWSWIHTSFSAVTFLVAWAGCSSATCGSMKLVGCRNRLKADCSHSPLFLFLYSCALNGQKAFGTTGCETRTNARAGPASVRTLVAPGLLAGVSWLRRKSMTTISF